MTLDEMASRRSERLRGPPKEVILRDNGSKKGHLSSSSNNVSKKSFPMENPTEALGSTRFGDVDDIRPEKMENSSLDSNQEMEVKEDILAKDKANPKPWYTADEKCSKMYTEYPLPEGWYARLPGLGEPANYGTKFETGVYEEQVKSGYRLPLHPFALRFFEHYRMAPGQLVPNGWRKLAGLIYLVQTSGYKPDATDFMRVFFEICFVKGVANCPGWYYIHSRQRLLKGGPKSNKGWHSRYFFVGRLDKGELPFDRVWNPFCKDFKNPGKPTPNNQTKHILSHIKLRGGLCIDEPLTEEQLEWAKIIPPKPIPAGLQIPLPPPAIHSVSSVETVPLDMASGSGKSQQGGFFGERKEKQPSVELPHVPKRTRVTPPERSPRILEQVSIEDDPIFRPRWTLRRDDLGMPDSQVSEQHLLHGILPRDKEVFQTQTHETFACSFAQAVYTMYASGSEMLSRFEMARQVAAEEAQLKREAVKEAQEATHPLEKRLDRVKRKATEKVTKARDQGIRDFLDGNAGDEWLKKRTEDGLEIYEMGFMKAKEMFVERFPGMPLDDFVMPAVVSPSGETAMPSEAGDAAASHLPGEGSPLLSRWRDLGQRYPMDFKSAKVHQESWLHIVEEAVQSSFPRSVGLSLLPKTSPPRKWDLATSLVGEMICFIEKIHKEAATGIGFMKSSHILVDPRLNFASSISRRLMDGHYAF
ncbi:hypothetical protein RJ640_016331 [Escallonia rubra]|uniref:Transposase (putative) gypsy type domain-containing protein n=1 Tax=Escallonia rubra TaxID=112253 RepID=A0AA88R719_9ASTE|nr:hypothetical protein RJ640_016331 [Escallonia rubra]